MAKIPPGIESKLQEVFPDVPLETAREGAKAAGNINSVQQVVALAVRATLDENGRIEGEKAVRKMLSANPGLADKLIEEHYGERGVGGYGVGY